MESYCFDHWVGRMRVLQGHAQFAHRFDRQIADRQTAGALEGFHRAQGRGAEHVVRIGRISGRRQGALHFRDFRRGRVGLAQHFALSQTALPLDDPALQRVIGRRNDHGVLLFQVCQFLHVDRAVFGRDDLVFREAFLVDHMPGDLLGLGRNDALPGGGRARRPYRAAFRIHGDLPRAVRQRSPSSGAGFQNTAQAGRLSFPRRNHVGRGGR